MAAQYVYASAATESVNSYIIEQRDGSDLSLIRTRANAVWCGIADDQLWTLERDGALRNLLALDPADISQANLNVSVNAATTRVKTTNDRIYLIRQTGVASNDVLQRIDPGDGSVIWTRTGGMGTSPDHAIDDGTHVYVAALNSPYPLTKIDADTGTIVSSVNLTIGRPTDLAALNGSVFASSAVPSRLQKVTTSSMTIASTYSFTGSGIDAISSYSDDIFYGRGNVFYRFDVASGTEVETLSTTYGHQSLVTLDDEFYTGGDGGSATTGELTRIGAVPLTQLDAVNNVAARNSYGVAAWSQAAPAGLSGIFVGAVVF